MPVGAKVLTAFKAGGKPPMPMPMRKGGASPAKPSPQPAAKPPASADEGAAPGAEAEVEGMTDGDIVQLAGHLADNGQADPAIVALMEHYDADIAEGAPPAWAPDEDTWSKAVEMVQPEQAPWKSPWLVVAMVYSLLGGEVDSGELAEHGGQQHAEPDGDEDQLPENPIT